MITKATLDVLHVYRWRGFDLDVGNIDFGSLDVFVASSVTFYTTFIWC